MTTVPHLAATLHEVLQQVALAEARPSGFTRRTSKLDAATFVQTLVRGWLSQPDASLDTLAHVAATRGSSLRHKGVINTLRPQRQRYCPTSCAGQATTSMTAPTLCAMPIICVH